MRKTNDITLKEAIDKMLNQFRLRGKFDETGVVSLWPEVLGAAVANRTKQIYIHERKLFVRIESAVIKNELLIVKSAIVDKLNERVGNKVIEDIVFL